MFLAARKGTPLNFQKKKNSRLYSRPCAHDLLSGMSVHVLITPHRALQLQTIRHVQRG